MISPYDPNDEHYQPITTSMTNSDGEQYHTEYIYPHDIASVAYDSMVSKNIIIPVETITSVGSSMASATITGGNKTNYELFTFGGSLYPKPKTYQNREVTWNNHTNYQDDGYVTQATVNSYDAITGNPSSISFRGWTQPHLFYWNTNGTPSKRSYQNYETEYLYKPGTRLLDKIINIDGTEQTYNWDQLSRLFGTVDVNGVSTVLGYHFGKGSNLNYVKTTTAYGDLGGVPRIVKDLNHYDGLYRPKQLKRYIQMPDQLNSILTETEYDIFGRAVESYEPYSQFANENSYDVSTQTQHTLVTYEASPLNRVASSTPPDWYATTVTYSSNAANEVMNHETGMYYAANSLYK